MIESHGLFLSVLICAKIGMKINEKENTNDKTDCEYRKNE